MADEDGLDSEDDDMDLDIPKVSDLVTTYIEIVSSYVQ
jgi:hypothetical protein